LLLGLCQVLTLMHKRGQLRTVAVPLERDHRVCTQNLSQSREWIAWLVA
jgi:hypothetical protein